ncbi:MAG: class III cytochrome C family protein [Magnetococcales bacterium]|nr:class III cytochrome C family protein [Magnetococcales bacterium]
MNRLVKYILLINLIVIMVLLFLYPHLMISPGRVLDGHRSFEADCFLCHYPFFGASSGRCISCHRVENIGVLSSKGVPLADKKTKVPFHQKLLDKSCVSCHSDHAGVAKYRTEGRFHHQILDNDTRNECVACHQRPGDPLHKQSADPCGQCHGVEKWRPAQFKHDLLANSQREQCMTCHKAKTPRDFVHRQVSENCGQCHTVAKWKPATFDHQPSFELDKEHNVKCAICHTTGNYKVYTCYGCHEHSVGKIRKEHWEEGIRDFDRCVSCHRNADKDEAETLWKSGRWRDGSPGVSVHPERGGVLWEQQPNRSKRGKHKDDDD